MSEDTTVVGARLGSTQDLTLAMAAEALVMMVDDEELLIELTRTHLQGAGYSRFVETTDPLKAIDLMERERPDVVLLDIHMPRMTGFQILERMRAHPQLRYIPAVVLSSADDAPTKLKALELGAADFLRKPVDESELVLRMRNTLAAKAYQDYLNYYDRGTGLANRRRFMDELERALRGVKTQWKMGAVLQFDLDRFAQVNDALGPATGDLVIREAGRRIRSTLRSLARPDQPRGEAAFAARFGGDEFSVLLPVIANVEQASYCAEALLNALAVPHGIEGKELHITSSIGVVLFPNDGDRVDDLLKNAGAALAQAKQAGRNAFRFYSKEFNAKAMQRLSLEADLRQAIGRGELRLFYQPKVNLQKQQICGCEALLRWQHRERGLVSPGEFIPLAEESGLIVQLGEWALREACRQSAAWAAQELPRVPIAVNLSPRQFQQANLPALIKSIIDASGQGAYLRLELTESSVMRDPKAALRMLQELKALGLKLSIDDFGTGYSSLSYLDKLPLDELKVDRSFIASIKKPDDTVVLVDTIIAMAHSLKLNVVAEGVETREQLEYLARRRCDEVQGYLISKPLPAEEFTDTFLRPKPARHG